MDSILLWSFCVLLRLSYLVLTHWGRATHICVGKPTITGSDNGLSPDRRQAIIWTNAGLLLIGPLGTNFSESLIEILTFSFKKMPLKVSSAKRRPFCLGLNVLKGFTYYKLWRDIWCLTDCGLVTPYGVTEQWLVAWQCQTITWANGDWSSVKYFGIHQRAIS